MRSRRWLLAISAFVLCLSATASYYALSRHSPSRVAHRMTPPSLTVKKTMTDDRLFEQVPFDTEKKNACSPVNPGFGWRGVKVRTPSQVVLPSQNAAHSALVLPLCGAYTLDIAMMSLHPGPLMLIVTDDATGKISRGPIVDRDAGHSIPPPPGSPIDPEMYKNQAFGSYFNYDVASYVELPLQPARYRVKVEWGGYESNEVIVDVVQGP
jgi:hypothetical protein